MVWTTWRLSRIDRARAGQVPRSLHVIKHVAYGSLPDHETHEGLFRKALSGGKEGINDLNDPLSPLAIPCRTSVAHIVPGNVRGGKLDT